MGLDTEVVRMLLKCRREGVDFRSTLTLGQQSYFPGIRESRRLFRESGLDAATGEKCGRMRPDSGPLWEALGAKQLTAMDASDYEKADWIHDLNHALPENHGHGPFSCVCDVGTMEHVFNFPMALRSALGLVEAGGHFLSFTTMNNYCGHGFYQFSPELFFRVLDQSNGYQLESMIAMEYGPRFAWYEVTDPGLLGRRTNLVNGYRVLLFIRARRLADTPVLLSMPQQSDYTSVWDTGSGSGAAEKAGALRGAESGRVAAWALETFPGLCRMAESIFYSFLNPRYNFRDKSAFRRIRKKQ